MFHVKHKAIFSLSSGKKQAAEEPKLLQFRCSPSLPYGVAVKAFSSCYPNIVVAELSSARTEAPSGLSVSSRVMAPPMTEAASG